jgi:hypothetical protein
MYYTLDTLFSLLSIDQIISIVGAMMNDATVVVIGFSLKEVSHTVLALQCLIEPCKYCGSIVPVLPSTHEFMALLDSPTPASVGTAPSPELRSLAFLDPSIFVTLDRQFLSSAAFPPFPNHRQIARKIESIICTERSRTPHPFGYPLVFRRCADHCCSFCPVTATFIAAAIRERLWMPPGKCVD